MIKNLISVLIALIIFHSAKADDFVVVSNSDSGPGTLREAITLANANGTSVSDNIIFNIADVSRGGRTIILQSELPELTSNLTIDGSTQSGDAIGKSDAKIILLINKAQSKKFTFLQCTNASNIQLYGLFLFNEVFTIFSSGAAIDGFRFYRSNNIVIGKPGKGNYFRGLQQAIVSVITSYTEWNLVNSYDISIQHNVFNNDEEGKPTIYYNNTWTVINPMEYAVYFQNVRNILIGGNSSTEGNSISAQNIYIMSGLKNGSGYCTISKNFFGTQVGGPFIDPYIVSKTLITIKGYDLNTDYDISIKDNLLGGRIYLLYISMPFTIQGNIIRANGGNGSSIDYQSKIEVRSCAGGVIGGEAINQRNEIFSIGPMNYNNAWSNSGVAMGSITVGNTQKVSIIKNKTHCTDLYGSTIRVENSGEPFVRIDETLPNNVKGKATPNCKIEVFLDDECWACDGVAYLGETVSNADSTWSFSGNFNGVIIATATNSAGTTSGYTEPTYSTEKVIVQQPTCGKENGYIKGMRVYGSVDNYEWHKITFDENGYYQDVLISRNLELENLGPGMYYFIAKLGETCRSAMMVYTLKNYTPKIDVTNQRITHPTCGLFNGSIFGLELKEKEYSVYKWINDMGKTVSSRFANTPYIDQLSAGKYKLIIIDTIVGCGDSTNFIELTNQSGPSLNTVKIEIVPATCGSNNGSIKNISAENATGNPFIQWLDSTNKQVGTNLDLLNVPAGKYRLKFKDQTGCDTITTLFYSINDLGKITIDTSNKIVRASSCSSNTGSIQNLKVSGAENYQWINTANNEIVGTSLDISTLSTGSYSLLAKNSNGCQLNSPVITVPPASFSSISVKEVDVKNASCNKQNGSVTILKFDRDASAYSFRWIGDATQQTIGTAISISNLNAGNYTLLAKDINSCEQEIYKTEIKSFPIPTFDYSAVQTINDECSEGKGSISKIQVIGLQGPTVYNWTDVNNLSVSTSSSLINAREGNYKLQITDGGNCIIESKVFSLANFDKTLSNPVYEDQIIPRNTATTLQLKSRQEGDYYLFNNQPGNAVNQKNTTGIFKTNIIRADSVFYIQQQKGSCKSEIVTVKIKVVDETKVYVPTAFTPNYDGRNDLLKPIVTGIFKFEYFIIYDRWGKKVFQSSDGTKGWNGYNNGIEAPVGVYVWILKGKDFSGKEMQQNGSFVLLR